MLGGDTSGKELKPREAAARAAERRAHDDKWCDASLAPDCVSSPPERELQRIDGDATPAAASIIPDSAVAKPISGPLGRQVILSSSGTNASDRQGPSRATDRAHKSKDRCHQSLAESRVLCGKHPAQSVRHGMTDSRRCSGLSISHRQGKLRADDSSCVRGTTSTADTLGSRSERPALAVRSAIADAMDQEDSAKPSMGIIVTIINSDGEDQGTNSQLEGDGLSLHRTERPVQGCGAREQQDSTVGAKRRRPPESRGSAVVRARKLHLVCSRCTLVNAVLVAGAADRYKCEACGQSLPIP